MMRRFAPLLSVAAEVAVEEFDAVIVGGGPAGLSAAIRLKQLAPDKDNFRVAVIEKGSAIGSHILSGACVEPRALTELLPDWRSMEDHPMKQEVTQDDFYLLFKNGQQRSPFLPPTMQNHGNYILSVGDLCKFLGERAEEAGVEVYPGFAAVEPIFNDDKLEGVRLNDMGVNKAGEQTDQYQPGMIFKAKQTLFAEGCRGSCTKIVEDKFKLNVNSQHQSYGLGVKEVWEVPKEQFRPGKILHTAGWPLTKAEGHKNTYGGTFMYDYGDCLRACGFVVGLDYRNPYTRPFMELQKWKTHPFIRTFFEGAKCISYGARTLAEGGLHSLPHLAFPGGVLLGDAAGFLNTPKIKGTHTAMKSGTLAAEALFEDVFSKGSSAEYGVESRCYEKMFRSSWLYKELKEVRNCRQSFCYGLYAGMMYTGASTMILKGREPWTLRFPHADHETLMPAAQCKPIDYPKPDGKLTFDLLSDHALSNTEHNHDQPCHLRLKDESIPEKVNLPVYDGPEEKYCPGGVYEYVADESGKKKLVINGQNCLHCKACDIKDPKQNINWTPPEGGGGPNYTSM